MRVDRSTVGKSAVPLINIGAHWKIRNLPAFGRGRISPAGRELHIKSAQLPTARRPQFGSARYHLSNHSSFDRKLALRSIKLNPTHWNFSTESGNGPRSAGPHIQSTGIQT